MSEPAMLADHIDRQSDEILAHWRTAVEQMGTVPVADRLPSAEFLDHVPALLDRLAERLRGAPSEAGTEGREHGRHRWRQGYDIADVVRELGQLRAALVRATGEFARVHGWDLAGYEAAVAAVDDVIEEATAESVRQFQQDSRGETQQALAEVKSRQRAIEDAWVAAQLEKAKLRAVLRNLPAAVYVIDPEGYIIGTNDEAERMQGFVKAEATGKANVYRLGPEYQLLRDDGSACPVDELPAVRALRGETVTQEEFVWVLQGEPRTVAVNAAPLTDASGSVLGAVTVLLDVTQRKQAEEQLRREREVSRTVTETVGEGLCTVDTAGRITFVNPAALRMLGWTAEGLLGRSLHGTVHARGRDDPRGDGSGGTVLVAAPDAPAPEECPIDRALRTGETVWGDEVFARRDGSRFVAEFTASPIVGEGKIVGLVQAFHDVTGRKRLQAELAASEARFRVIAEKSPVMIWRTDPAGRCDWVNETWCEFRGLRPEQCQGDGWADAVHPEDRPRVVEGFRDALARRAPFEASYRMRRRDGQHRWVNNRATPLFGADGALLGYLGSCLDITHRIELEHALEEQRKLAEEASLHKTRLLSALSHDARTPLNAVVLAAQLLEVHFQGEPDPEVRECLRTISGSVRNVLDLLGDLLNLSKIDAGALPAEVSRFPLDQVLAECLSSVETQARMKGLAVRLEPGPLAGTVIETDRAKLKQIVCNLLSNALRYTDRGHIRLYGARPDDQIRIAVEDTGIGIAPDDRDRIFDEFAVLDNPQRRAGEGTGLGLAICRRLANLLKGEIALESTPGAGSTFTLVLPASVLTGEPATAADGPAPSPSGDGNGQAARRAGAVLIVEDHLDSRQTLARVLRRMGFRVLEAGNGRDALALARTTPDLRAVLMDVNMPVMDGVEATRALRADPELHAIPIFALTGDVSVVNQHRIGEAGVNGFLEKPVTWEALREALGAEERPEPR
jgi:PAS domain S-box-containing protein